MLVAGIRWNEKFFNVHLHLTPTGSACWRDNLRFRDRLRADPELAKRYGQIKSDAVRHGIVEAAAYNEAKAPFILGVLKGKKHLADP